MAAMKIGRNLCRIRQSTVDRNLIATGGKENDLQVWDVCNLQSPITTFMSKNVKPDKLQVNINDLNNTYGSTLKLYYFFTVTLEHL